MNGRHSTQVTVSSRAGSRRAPRRTFSPRVLALPALVLSMAVGLPIALLGQGHDGGDQGAPPAAAPNVESSTPAAAVGPSRAKTSRPSPRASVPAADAVADSAVYTEASNLWVVVNKAQAITPLNYAPQLATVDDHEVDRRMAPHLRDLLDAARANGTPLRVVSGYRSYDHQVEVYEREVARLGKRQADRLSARPGHSEHQTGLAVDVDNLAPDGCLLNECFGLTAGGTWLADHAAAFGFIVRYTARNQAITGYDPEPWHIRYIGAELAQKLDVDNIDSLESYFGVAGGRHSGAVAVTTTPEG